MESDQPMLDRYNRIIFSANPCFTTEKESGFWTHFDRICEREGWRLFKHSMRKIPGDNHTMILPARLSDVSGFIGGLPSGVTESDIPAWFERSNFDQIIEWEMRRWQLKEHNLRLDLGLTRLAWHIDHLFSTLRPAGTIVSNKIDHGTALFYWAAQHYGSQTIFFERSPLETFIVEDRGMFAESEIWDRYAAEIQNGRLRHLAHGKVWMDHLVQNTDGFRPQNFTAPEESLAQLKKIKGQKFFLPLDNTLWTGWAQDKHWQGTIDYYPQTPSPSEAIRLLARISAQHDATLVVKKHPSDIQEYENIDGNVVFIDAPLELLIKECDLCLCFLTKVAFVSAAIGKPTVTLAPNTAAASGGLFHAERVGDWETVIATALAVTPSEMNQRKTALQNLLGWLGHDFYMDSTLPADFDKPGAMQLLTRIASSPAGIIAGGSISALDNMITSKMTEFKNKKSWLRAPKVTSEKLHLVFDVSRLANTRLRYSGISRFSQKVFSLLGESPEIERVAVLCKPQNLKLGAHAGDLPGFSRHLGAEVLLPQEIGPRINGKDAVYFSPYDELTPLPGVEIPRIVTVHDVLHITASEWYLSPTARRHIDIVLNSISERDMVATVSEFTRMQLMRVKAIAPDRIETVHLAADESFRPRTDTEIAEFRQKSNIGDDPYFVLFGQFEFRKNLPTTLSAVRHAQEGGSKARFVIVGSAIGIEAMRNAVIASGLDNERIVFLPGPEDDEIAAAYSGAHGMLYVSIAEGFGLPVIEALKCGCPVITSAVTSIPEVAGDGALYVDPYNAAQISDAIHALEGSASLRAQLRAKGLERSSRFTWARTVDGLVRVAQEAFIRGTSSTPEAISQKVTQAQKRQKLLTFCSSLLLARTVEEVVEIEDDPDLGGILSLLPETDALRLHYDQILRHIRYKVGGSSYGVTSSTSK